ncbi:MAG: LTA synthase family protein [Oscillospiraceae bacterium]|nr:LTA synthase family protein [Oscillospiraceae bacterium]
MEKRIDNLKQFCTRFRLSPDAKEAGKRIAFFPGAILYMELVLRLWSNRPFWGMGLLYIALFSAAAGSFCNVLASLFPERARRVVHWALLSLFTLLFIVQTVFYTIFRGYAELDTMAIAGAAIDDFFLETIRVIGTAILPVLLLLLPLALFQALHLWKHRPIVCTKGLLSAAAVAVMLHAVTVGAIMGNQGGYLPLRSIYREHFTLNLATQNFGMVTGMRLDAQYMVLGQPEPDLAEVMVAIEQPTPPPPTPRPIVPEDEYEPKEEEIIDFGYNILDIDFEALLAEETRQEIREMHEFFMHRPATPRTEFTGMFEGKNLIWIVGEAFHGLAIHPEITPTLYRLRNEGMYFSNFYTPDTGFSTAGGEFGTMLGMIPGNRNAFPQTAHNYMPFAFGNQFRAKGYETWAFHNHNHTFNSRHHTHPNLGYEFIAIGNGLDIPRHWPASDLDMMQATVDYFINAEQFHVYYITVSGHLEYNFFGNAMAARHQETVADLPYSTGPRAFLATQIELDLAIEYLIQRLDEAGRLADTVLVLSGDHYPYGLSHAEMEELGGVPIRDPLIDVHHSPLLIWNYAMEEQMVIETYSSFYDVMPTVANLFGLPFDSRLVIGTDILSGTGPFVRFASRSWVSQYGRFNSHAGSFTPHPHIDPDTVPYNHAQQMTGWLTVLETHSARIVAHDYFRIVLERSTYNG